MELVIIGDQKLIVNFTQFETTIWAQHNKTNWQWKNKWNIMTLV